MLNMDNFYEFFPLKKYNIVFQFNDSELQS